MPDESPLFEVSFDDLRPGFLAHRFAAGGRAAVITYDAQCHQVWKDLMQNPEEQLPWEATLLDIARNHIGGRTFGDELGDMHYFVPGTIAYIARKFELQYKTATSTIEAVPLHFLQQGKSFTVADDAIRRLWTVVGTILSSLVSNGRSVPTQRAVVHRLKYQAGRHDNQKLYELASHSGGTWARVGGRVDARRGEARGLLSRRGFRDLFAISSLLSPARPLFDSINRRLMRHDALHAVPNGSTIIGSPHCDGRYFSALSGDRSNVVTEMWADGHWIELPVDPGHFVILPGLLAQKHLQLRPTMHRVIHLGNGEGASAGSVESPNVTLLLGAK